MRNAATIDQVIQDVADDLAMFNDRNDKNQYIIDSASSVPLIRPELKLEENIIRGCQARVWLHAEKQDGVIHFTADSDTIISKGMIAILFRILNDRPPEELLSTSLSNIDRIGLRSILTFQRGNGLVSMLDQMKRYALAYSSKS